MLEAATLLDIPEVVELGRVMHAESDYRGEHYSPEKVGRLMASLAAGGGLLLVERSGGRIVGAVAGCVQPQWFGDDLIGLEYGVFVLPEVRASLSGGKVFLRLLRGLQHWCRAQGARRLRAGITTGVHLEITSALYRAQGFHDAGAFFEMEL